MPQVTARPDVERLVNCDKFVLDRWQLTDPQPLGGDQRCHLVAVLEGATRVDRDATGNLLVCGETALVPAQAGPINVSPDGGAATLLDICLP